jgi:hypothetical protein
MPASSVAGGSTAPMANSPPEIQTIPCGEAAGPRSGLGIVGPKAAASAASAASVVGGPASTLLGGRRGHGRKTATAVAAEVVRAIRIHIERLNVECFGAVCALVGSLFLIRALAAFDSDRL